MTEDRIALLLGGTGHIGHAILRELLARGYRVRAVSRTAQNRAAFAGLDVTLVQGDTDAGAGIEPLLEGVSVVVDAAAPYPLYLPETGRGATDPVGKAAERTARIAEAARRGGAALVFISSFTTLPSPGGLWSELEAGMRRAIHPYFAAKEEMEGATLAAFRRGLRAVIVNPTACLGPWDRKPRSLCYLPLLLTGEIPATMRRAVNVIDVRDLARGAIAALEAGLFGRPLLFSGHDIRADELSARACALAGTRPPIFRASARATATAAYWTERLFQSLRLPAPFPSLPALLLCEARAMGIGAAQRALGVLPRPLDETLRDAIVWYRRLGYIPPSRSALPR